MDFFSKDVKIKVMQTKYHILVIYILFALGWRAACTNSTNGTTSSPMNVTRKQHPPPCQQMNTTLKYDIFVAIQVVIFIVGFVGNVVAIATITFSRRLRKMMTNIFVGALAACDIGVIVFIIPIRLDIYLYDRNFCFDIHVCRMFSITDLLFHTSSICHLFLIALERFIAVNYPFFYQRVMSRGKTLTCIFITWVYSAFWSAMALYDIERPSSPTIYILAVKNRRFCLVDNRIFFNVVYFVIYIIPLAIMGGLYFTILRVAIKQARIIESLSITLDGQSKKRRKEVRATKTLAIVYGCFTICWLPLIIISITFKWFPADYHKFRRNHPLFYEVIFSLFIEVLPALNSCLNPFLYILFNKKFRQEMNILWNKVRQATPTFTIDSDSSVSNNNRNNPMNIREPFRIYEPNKFAENNRMAFGKFSTLESGTNTTVGSSQTEL